VGMTELSSPALPYSKDLCTTTRLNEALERGVFLAIHLETWDPIGKMFLGYSCGAQTFYMVCWLLLVHSGPPY